MAGVHYQEPQFKPIIGVFGTTGTGKTSLIQTISGHTLKVGHGLRSCTSAIQEVHCEVDGYPTTLVDTPGFNDTERSETEILILMAEWLEESHGVSVSQCVERYRLNIVEKQVVHRNHIPS
jgi:predicted GTPase